MDGDAAVTLEQVLADARGEAAVLRRNGHQAQAEALERFADAAASACPEYLTELVEHDAAGYRGCSTEWLRRRFQGWCQRGLARQIGPRRYYRLCVLEHKGSPSIAREAGRQAYRGAA